MSPHRRVVIAFTLWFLSWVALYVWTVHAAWPFFHLYALVVGLYICSCAALGLLSSIFVLLLNVWIIFNIIDRRKGPRHGR